MSSFFALTLGNSDIANKFLIFSREGPLVPLYSVIYKEITIVCWPFKQIGLWDSWQRKGWTIPHCSLPFPNTEIIYCKSSYNRDVLIFAIFRKSTALQIYQSTKDADTHNYENPSSRIHKSVKYITERVYCLFQLRNKDYVNIKQFAVYMKLKDHLETE